MDGTLTISGVQILAACGVAATVIGVLYRASMQAKDQTLLVKDATITAKDTQIAALQKMLEAEQKESAERETEARKRDQEWRQLITQQSIATAKATDLATQKSGS